MPHCSAGWGDARAYQAALIGEGAVGADERVAGNALPEDLHAQHVRHQLLGLLPQARRQRPIRRK